MSAFNKDILDIMAEEMITESAKLAVKSTVNELVEKTFAGEDVDWSEFSLELIDSIITVSGKRALSYFYEEYVVLNENVENRFINSLCKFVKGEQCIEAAYYDEVEFTTNSLVDNLFKSLNIGTAVLDIKNQCESLVNARDEEYFVAMNELCNSCLNFTNVLASSIPLIGDIIKTTVSAAKGAFENQYNYIVNDLESNNNYYAKLVLNFDLEEAALYLLAQENLIFDKEAMVTMMIDKEIREGNKEINLGLLTVGALVCETHDQLMDFYAITILGYADVADAIRNYCKDLLVDNGFDIKYLTFEQIQENLSILHGNIEKAKKEQPGDYSLVTGSYNTGYEYVTPYTYRAAVTAGIIKNNAATAAFDPLVIDMGKTGFELTDVENGVNFDMDANGFAEKTGWITGDDAFLALDRNGNGIIDNGGELFGDRTLLSNGTYATSGFEALAEFDSNLDRLINAHDEVYRQLRLWQDKNRDGICTPDELMTLEEAGISAINLNYESMNKTDDATGSVLSNISSVVFDDGTETAVGEFKFNADKIDTKDIINFELSEEILSLPNVRAIGGVHSLHYAMAMDETGTLQSLVSRFVESSDFDERSSLLTDILYFLCDASDIDPTSRGSYIDARHLAVIEKMTDGEFVGLHGPNPSYLAGPELEKAYDLLFNAYYNDLVLPKVGKYLNFILEKTDAQGNIYNDVSLFNPYVSFHLNKGDLSEMQLMDLGRLVLQKDVDAFIEFKGFFNTGDYSYGALIEKCSGEQQGTDNNDYLNAPSEGGIVFGNGGNDNINGSAGEDVLFGGAGEDTLYGNNGSDILDGGEGNDFLRGGEGDDTYIFGKGYGTDKVYDYMGLNSIKFTDINADDLKVYKTGSKDLTIEVRETGDKLVIESYFYDKRHSNFTYQFADGTVWNYEDMTNHLRIMYGTDGNDSLNPIYDSTAFYGLGGNDSIYGSKGNDILDGGEGDDLLRGGEGDDTYIFGKGYGTDKVYDYMGLNSIKFTDINADDLKVYKTGSKDLTIEVRETGDKLVIESYFYDERHSNFTYQFADGTVWNYEDMTNHLRTMYGTDGNDTLTALYDSTTFDGKGGNDTLNGSAGDDIMFGGEGDDTLNGNNGNDILDGGAGNDFLRGGEGDDTYIFGKGYGTDKVYDYMGLNSVKFTDINADDLKVYKTGSKDLTIEVRETGDKLVIESYFYDERHSNFTYQFADGTVWNYEDMTNHLRTMYGTDGNDSLNPIYDSTAFYGLGGNDSIYGSKGNDILDGGAGNDVLYGGEGDDTYIFGKGYGTDKVYDYMGLNSIKFTDINADDLKVYKTGSKDLTIEVRETGDKLVIESYFYDERHSNFTYQFADGTVWNYEDMTNHLRTMYGTDGNDTLTALYDSTTFDGKGGNDTLNGSAGDDTMFGGAGDDNLYGNNGSDILDGGAGNDFLRGGEGDDTYIFGKGYGTDKVYDYMGLNSIKFTDINADDLKVYKTGSKDLTIEVRETGDKLVIESYFYDERHSNFTYQFADGTVWNYEDMTNHLRTMYGTDGNDSLNPIYDSTAFYGLGGNDSIYGSKGNDILDGGEGDDLLRGEEGNDTYIFGKGYGTDKVYDYMGLNSVKFTDINADDLKVYKTGSKDLTIEVRETGDKLVIESYFYDERHSNFTYQFADGLVTTLDKENLKFNLPESDDIYNFSSGDGSVIIQENGGDDILQIHSDILNTVFSREGDSLNILLNDSNDVLTVDGWFVDESKQIETINTGDGYSLSNLQVQLLIENMASYSDSNNISWVEAIQQDRTGVESVLNQIWVKQ